MLQVLKNKLIGYIKNKEPNNLEINKHYSLGFKSVLYDSSIVSTNNKKEKNILIGNYCHIRGKLHTFFNGNIILGDYCYLGENSHIWAASNIIIGNRVLISHNVNIHDNISHPLNAHLRHEDFKRIIGLNPNFDISQVDLRVKDIIIKDDVWIGFNSTIYKGVTIGKAAIVGSNSLVLEDVPDYAVVVGNPAKIIKYTT